MQTTPEYDAAVAAERDVWVPACGGTETRMQAADRRTVLYVYNPARGEHRYLDCGSDMLLPRGFDPGRVEQFSLDGLPLLTCKAVVAIDEDVPVTVTDREVKRGLPRKTRFSNLSYVETWWDRQSRNWISSIIDASGDQVGDAHIDGSQASAKISHGWLVDDAIAGRIPRS